jgi:hypothetical protein
MVRDSVTIWGTMTVFSTVSHVPHELPQLVAQGAEQHELALLPKQPACTDAVIRTAAANDKTYRMSEKLQLESSERFTEIVTTFRGTPPKFRSAIA